MAYYLMLEDKKNYKNISINLANGFVRNSKFNSDCYSLLEIDNFTSLFASEVELKKALYNEKLISFDDIVKDISIRSKSGDKYSKVKFDLIYKSTYKYLDTEYLRHMILSLKSDIDFLEKFMAFYRNSYNNSNTIPRLRYFIYNGNEDKRVLPILNEIFLREIYSIDKETGETKLKYKSLHDLAMFVNNYLNGKTSKKKELLELQKEIILDNDTNRDTMLINPKKKVLKKKEQVEGQLSFLDI